MELTKVQKEAVHCIDGHLQIIACAGSGKTEVISRRIVNILQKKSDVKVKIKYITGNFTYFCFYSTWLLEAELHE